MEDVSGSSHTSSTRSLLFPSRTSRPAALIILSGSVCFHLRIVTAGGRHQWMVAAQPPFSSPVTCSLNHWHSFSNNARITCKLFTFYSKFDQSKKDIFTGRILPTVLRLEWRHRTFGRAHQEAINLHHKTSISVAVGAAVILDLLVFSAIILRVDSYRNSRASTSSICRLPLGGVTSLGVQHPVNNSKQPSAPTGLGSLVEVTHWIHPNSRDSFLVQTQYRSALV